MASTAALLPEIIVGISSCLVGHKVRYDGQHKHDPFLTDTLGRFVRFVPICPEVGIGLGTPRETIRLERHGDVIRLTAPKSGADHTQAMQDYAKARAAEVEPLDLCGYVFKKDSPSCGLFRVKVYGESGLGVRNGRGLYAKGITQAHPLLPVEEEGRLNDVALRDNFVERVFAYRRVKALCHGRLAPKDLIAFHAREKLLLMAHAPAHYQTLGALVAHAKEVPAAELKARYQAGYMAAMAELATAKRHTNVLQHIAGYFKKSLDIDDRRELSQIIDDYHRGLVPLIVPITLIKHFLRKAPAPYLAAQSYLEPHPKELLLRNHV